MSRQPIAIDLFCGLGGWTQGLLNEGYRVVGFDIEEHDYGDGKRYPAQLVIQDVLTIHGRQFKDATLIVASPPCQEYSYMAMPWSRAKTIATEYRSGKRDVKKLTMLFDACFRIQREAIEAAGHFIPMVVENVRGAQPLVGRARWNFGNYYLWGDVPALMPITMTRRMKSAISCAPRNFSDRVASTPEEAHRLHYRLPDDGVKLPGNNGPRLWSEREVQRLCDAGRKNDGGSWFNIGSPGQKEVNRNPVHELAASGFKIQGMNWSDRTLRGQDFTRIAGRQAEGTKDKDADGYERIHPQAFGWKAPRTTSKSSARKAASATIAKIPLPLARWIAKVYRTARG